MGSGSPGQADSHRESSDCSYNHVACYSGLAAFARSISGHRPSALGLLLQRRRALEVLRSVHVHEPSSLLTFDLMGISMWMSIEISIEISIGCPWTSPWRCPWTPYGYLDGYLDGHPHGDAHQIEGKQARRFMYMNRTQHLQRPSALEQQPECRRPMTGNAPRKSRKAGVASDVIVATITRFAVRIGLPGRPRPHGRLRLQTAHTACATTVFHLCDRGVTLVSTLLWRCCFGDLRAAARA